MKTPLLIIILLMKIVSAYAQPSAAEYNALMDLYTSTNGPGWTNNAGWSTANPNVVQSVVGWAGVTTDPQGHVTSLNLSGNKLSGPIPSTIGDLTELSGLNFDENSLTGNIPSSIWTLTKLTFFHLRINQLTGSIPSQVQNLTNLQNLALDGNQLSGQIPTTIGNLSSLEWLWLGYNNLSGIIPAEIGNITTLVNLGLENNHLTGSIPSSFGQLVNLNGLNLSSNNLSGQIPATLGNLNNLLNLYLRINQLTGTIPSSLGGLTAMQNLALDNNQLSGPIPSSLQNLENMTLLWLGANQLSGSIPSQLGNLTNLSNLYLGHNNLTGPIPSSLGNLSALMGLDLSENQLTGSIPSSLGRLTNLTHLTVRVNQLSGNIPDSIGFLSSARVIIMDHNQFSGQIPSSIGNLGNLEILILYLNNLEGAIPASIRNCTKLYTLTLNQNSLTDSIPSAIGDLADLANLELGTNQLSGKIPSSIGNLTKLKFLDLSNNQLTGSIPQTMGDLDAIVSIWLDRNKLTGTIPVSLGNLTTLRGLSLWSNDLTGGLPASLASLPDLDVLRLDVNHLTGPIPGGFASQGLTTFTVNSNNFSMEDLLNVRNVASYAPQDSIDSRKTLLGTIGNPLVLTTGIDRNTTPASKYQWIKYTPSVFTVLNEPSESGHTITLPLITQADIGTIFYYRITNDSLPGLVLYSLPQKLVLDSAGECGTTLTQEFNALLDLYESTNGAEWLDRTGWKDASRNSPQRIENWYGIRTDENGHVTDIDLDGSADWTTITNSEGYQVYTGNGLAGTLPPSIGNLGCLRVLNVGGNQFTGPIPSEIGQLSNLVWLVGSTNQFSGPLPPSIGNLTKLDRILMEKNQLSGEIPSTIGNLKDLWALLLNDNLLTGPIPQELGNLKKVRYFYLYNNQLSGSIPKELGRMTIAYRIGIQNNKLTGVVPDSLANLTYLQLLYLGDNDLEGMIPTSIASLPALTRLSFPNNRFTFSSFLDLKNAFTGSVFEYIPQDSIDVERTIEATLNSTVSLTTTIDRNTASPSIYQWFKLDNGTATALNAASAQGHTHTISGLSAQDAEASFYYTITNSSAPNLTLTSRLQKISITTVSTSDMNYIKTTDVTVEGIVDQTVLDDAEINERMINYVYFDGLGRPVQSVQQQSSPLGNDIVTPIRYDELGREIRKYLPIVVGNSGAYKLNSELINGTGDYIGAAQQFYNGSDGDVASDMRPFSETVFEASPLNRPLKDYGPGADWKTNEKFIQHSYLSNVSGSTGASNEEDIIAWKVDAAGLPVKESTVADYIENGHFVSKQLHIKVTIDEHGNSVREYTNKQGQVILKKVQVIAGSTNLNNLGDWACTYYIYDDLGDLRFVLPPEGVKQYLTIQN